MHPSAGERESSFAMDVTVRHAEKRDAGQLGALWLEFLREQSSFDERVAIAEDALPRWRNDFPLWLDRGSRYILVAEREGSLLGFITAVKSAPPPVFKYAPEAYVEELYVHPRARQNGVGRRLFKEMVAWADRWGARRVRLSVLSMNEAGLVFWRKIGFTDLSVTLTTGLSSTSVRELSRKKAKLGF